MTNSYRDYKQNFINNLPSGVTYDSDLGRFFFNGKKFYTAQSVVWYRDYILKYDSNAIGFDPASLFASSEEGAWYEPSPSTCFTDTGGTTAASVGDPVARINDLSGNGNHATQGTLASRPILRQTGGGLHYLEFDGTDDFMSVALTPGADKAQLFVGVGKNTNHIGFIIEHTANSSTNNGTFGLWTFDSPANSYLARARGTLTNDATGAGVSASEASVLTGLYDIAGDSTSLRRNSALLDEGTSDAGTGNFSNNTAYIGRRAGVSFPLNGNIYTLILRFGPNLDAQTVSKAETYVGGLTA